MCINIHMYKTNVKSIAKIESTWCPDSKTQYTCIYVYTFIFMYIYISVYTHKSLYIYNYEVLPAIQNLVVKYSLA